MSLLVLLVGMNPLPNWVAFQSLLLDQTPPERRPERVLLVHSDRTVEVAARLQAQIERRRLEVRQLPLTNARDGAAIRRDLSRALNAYGNAEPIHLNYTGGTKEMAVSSYAAVQGLGQRVGAVTFSYLDIEQHRLRFDDGSAWPLTGDLRGQVTIDLKDLLELHGRRLLDDGSVPPPIPPYPRTTEAIWAALCGSEDIATRYTAWVKGAFASDDGSLRPAPKLHDTGGFTLPADDPLQAIAETFRQEIGLTAGPEHISWQALYAAVHADNRRQRERAWKDSAGLFHGTWLEYGLWRRIADQVRGQTGWHLDRGVEARPEQGGKEAELDVVLIRGYQFFVMSCTTAINHRLLKGKAFEVMHRAQQFGGEEARPFVVSPLNGRQVLDLRQDVESDIGSAANLRVWGLQELRDFEQTWADLLREEQLA